MKSDFSLNRRSLIKGSLLSGISATAAALLTESAKGNTQKLPKGSVLLFQGDSITDAGRDRRSENKANHAGMLGRGYPHIIAGQALAKLPAKDLKIYNRGISGNKVPDLAARWDKDCIALKPTILSILIGVNDIWHKLNGNYDGTVGTYQKGFAALIERTKKKLPEVKIVICEPFVLRCGAVKDNWFPEFDQRRAAAKKVASDTGALFVAYQTMFDEAVAAGSKPQYWAADGVHPTVAGHTLMANAWINSVSNS